ncbi:leucine/isoleucine/valine transporter subunit; ATP-binding component of ABC superfamily [Candidatus Desulfarcum epimagneticum]|uniref:Leucine/isoleucine/valine transporter subunit ATP-binding component of ABC superfamily n=1 Tax=uncultured Desulfobacteraceae bacterium TaxID=218296 RepID=A0A484HJG0_9BACT|nr:leucine/isoleucine/valine transporter subunit; ATP-binding component of ABC superfamily [uncultured Desulfobacteraceae bacterium]
MALLDIQNLSIQFGGIRALSDISIRADAGEILAVIGPNGSGKTTLFNCISGSYKPQGGRILFDGKDIAGLAPHRIARLGIARTFQNLRLFLNMTVLDNLLLGRHIKFRKNFLSAILRRRGEELRHRETAEELIDFLKLEAYRKTRVADCPYGIQKRAEIGRSLALEPRMLMLDEPISGLTAEEKQETAYLINEIRGRFKTAILLVEHDLRLASDLADRMAAIDSGVKICEGTPGEVRRNPDVGRAYLGGEAAVDEPSKKGDE